MIRPLTHTEINKQKWDDCIAHSVFETIYPYSWYLDVVSPGWYALVKDDYEMVMPLTWKRKFGIRMLMQPLLAQQLGVFTRKSADIRTINEFMKYISPGYLLVDICLNRDNRITIRSFTKESRYNHEMDIPEPGMDPQKSYNNNTLRNLLRARESGNLIESVGLDTYLNLKFSLKENASLQRHRRYFERLYSCLLEKGRAEILGVRSEGTLHTAALFAHSGTRTLYLNGCTTEKGREKRGMFLIMDHMIRIRQGRCRVFDFEGSGIPGVARFFEGFGAKRTTYTRITRNPFQLMGISFV